MVKQKILLTVAAFQPQKHDFGFTAECIPNLVSKFLRDAGSIEVALIFFMPRDDKSEASIRGASAIVGYEDFLSELKSRISKAQLRAVVAVNKELILLYWQIGQMQVTHYPLDEAYQRLRLRTKKTEFSPEEIGNEVAKIRSEINANTTIDSDLI